jgi:hypothetical protein
MDDQVQDPNMYRIHCWWSWVIEVEGSSRGVDQWDMLIPVRNSILVKEE